MKNYVPSGDTYYVVVGVVREVCYLDCLYQEIEEKIKSVFKKIRIDSNSPVETLIVSPIIPLNKGDKIWAYFEKYSLDGIVQERELDTIEMPDILKIVKDNKAIASYTLFQASCSLEKII